MGTVPTAINEMAIQHGKKSTCPSSSSCYYHPLLHTQPPAAAPAGGGGPSYPLSYHGDDGQLGGGGASLQQPLKMPFSCEGG